MQTEGLEPNYLLDLLPPVLKEPQGLTLILTQPPDQTVPLSSRQLSPLQKKHRSSLSMSVGPGEENKEEEHDNNNALHSTSVAAPFPTTTTNPTSSFVPFEQRNRKNIRRGNKSVGPGSHVQLLMSMPVPLSLSAQSSLLDRVLENQSTILSGDIDFHDLTSLGQGQGDSPAPMSSREENRRRPGSRKARSHRPQSKG